MPDGLIGFIIGVFMAPLVWLIFLAIVYGIDEFIKERKKQKGPFI